MPRPNPFLLVTMLFWGFNFISLKILFPVMEPAAILFWRYFAMGGILVAICQLTGNSLKIPRDYRNRILFAGFNSMGLYMIFFMEGVKLTYAAEPGEDNAFAVDVEGMARRSLLMKAVVEQLSAGDMLNISAYLASLQP